MTPRRAGWRGSTSMRAARLAHRPVVRRRAPPSAPVYGAGGAWIRSRLASVPPAGSCSTASSRIGSTWRRSGRHRRVIARATTIDAAGGASPKRIVQRTPATAALGHMVRRTCPLPRQLLGGTALQQDRARVSASRPRAPADVPPGRLGFATRSGSLVVVANWSTNGSAQNSGPDVGPFEYVATPASRASAFVELPGPAAQRAEEYRVQVLDVAKLLLPPAVTSSAAGTQQRRLRGDTAPRATAGSYSSAAARRPALRGRARRVRFLLALSEAELLHRSARRPRWPRPDTAARHAAHTAAPLTSRTARMKVSISAHRSRRSSSSRASSPAAAHFGPDWRAPARHAGQHAHGHGEASCTRRRRLRRDRAPESAERRRAFMMAEDSVERLPFACRVALTISVTSIKPEPPTAARADRADAEEGRTCCDRSPPNSVESGRTFAASDHSSSSSKRIDAAYGSEDACAARSGWRILAAFLRFLAQRPVRPSTMSVARVPSAKAPTRAARHPVLAGCRTFFTRSRIRSCSSTKDPIDSGTGAQRPRRVLGPRDGDTDASTTIPSERADSSNHIYAHSERVVPQSVTVTAQHQPRTLYACAPLAALHCRAILHEARRSSAPVRAPGRCAPVDERERLAIISVLEHDLLVRGRWLMRTRTPLCSSAAHCFEREHRRPISAGERARTGRHGPPPPVTPCMGLRPAASAPLYGASSAPRPRIITNAPSAHAFGRHADPDGAIALPVSP